MPQTIRKLVNGAGKARERLRHQKNRELELDVSIMESIQMKPSHLPISCHNHGTETPTESTPTQSIPTQSTSTQSTATQPGPRRSTPSQSQPTQTTSTQSGPAQSPNNSGPSRCFGSDGHIDETGDFDHPLTTVSRTDQGTPRRETIKLPDLFTFTNHKPITGNTRQPRPLSLIPEGEPSRPRHIRPIPYSEQRSSPKQQDDATCDYAAAIAQRDAAVASHDEDELLQAQKRLELVLWDQQTRLGRTSPAALVAQREVVATSLLTGVWEGTPVRRWRRADWDAMEAKMRDVCAGLETARDPELAEAMLVTCSIRIARIEDHARACAAFAAALDILRDHSKDSDEETSAPQRQLEKMRVAYKVGSTIAPIWRYGQEMLGLLLRDADELVDTIGEEDRESVRRLRKQIGNKVVQLKKRRAREEVKERSGGKGGNM